MKEAHITERFDVERLDAKTIDKITNNIARTLAQSAKDDPNAKAKGHIKLGHIEIGFSQSGHSEIVIGGPTTGGPKTGG